MIFVKSLNVCFDESNAVEYDHIVHFNSPSHLSLLLCLDQVCPTILDKLRLDLELLLLALGFDEK